MTTTRVGLHARAGVAVAAAVGIAILTLVPGLETAQAATPAGKGAVVVQVVNRSPVGNMLATTTGASLYIHPSGPCTGSCLSVWPALLMPAGKTKPKGAECLTTVSTSGGLQVRYHNQAALHLYGRQRFELERQRCGRLQGHEGHQEMPVEVSNRAHPWWVQ